MKAKRSTAKIFISAVLLTVGGSALAINHFSPAIAAGQSTFGVSGKVGNNVTVQAAMPAPVQYNNVKLQQNPINLMSNLNQLASRVDKLDKPPVKPLPTPVRYQAINYPAFKATIYPGNLKFNLQQVAIRYHWHLIWQLGDYNFHTFGKLHYQAALFPVLIHKIIANYPVHAKLYTNNRVLLILPSQ